MKKTLSFIGLFAFIVLSLIACGESSLPTTSGSNPSQAAQSTPKDGKVGDVVSVGDSWTFKVSSAKTNNGSEFLKPQKAGDVFLVVNASIVNKTSKTQNVSSLLDFKLADSDGQAYNSTVSTSNKASIDGAVRANNPMTGELTFEVPASIKKYTLTFTPSSTGGSDSGTVDISL